MDCGSVPYLYKYDDGSNLLAPSNTVVTLITHTPPSYPGRMGYEGLWVVRVSIKIDNKIQLKIIEKYYL